MEIGAVTSYIDVAQLSLYAFWIFFACLIVYLRQEDRREGYPLESDPNGVVGDKFSLFFPIPREKSFHLEDGSTVTVPNYKRDTRAHKMQPVEPWPGAPNEPVGDPMLANVGPGSFAERADVIEQTIDNRPKIVPISTDSNFRIAAADPDPVGMPVYGADGAQAGVISDVWVDRSETIVRYLEVQVSGAPAPSETAEGGAPSAPKTVLLPVPFANINRKAKKVDVTALMGAQFAGVPTLSNRATVSRLEEERIAAFYGAGTLYAEPKRTEALF